MGVAPMVTIGRNFAKPIPRKVAENKKSFLQKLLKLWYNWFLETKENKMNPTFNELASKYNIAVYDGMWKYADKIKTKILALGYTKMVDGVWVK